MPVRSKTDSRLCLHAIPVPPVDPPSKDIRSPSLSLLTQSARPKTRVGSGAAASMTAQESPPPRPPASTPADPALRHAPPCVDPAISARVVHNIPAELGS